LNESRSVPPRPTPSLRYTFDGQKLGGLRDPRSGKRIIKDSTTLEGLPHTFGGPKMSF